MLKLFVITIFGALLALASVSAQAQDADCDAICKASQNPQAAMPAVDDMVCIFFVQPEAGTVVLTLGFSDGRTRIYSRPKGREDKFCIGRHWLERSVTLNVCNVTTGSTDYSAADVGVLAGKPKDSRQLTACLYGSAACAQMGYENSP